MTNHHEQSSNQPAQPAEPAEGANPPQRDHRISSTTLLLALLVVIFCVVVAAVLLQIFVADHVPPLTEARLEEAEQLWEQNGPASYDMDIEIRGAQPGQVHIEIRGGRVTAMTRDGIAPPERTWDVWSVPGQFDTLGRELVLAEDPQHEMDVKAGTELQLRCEFDSRYGFPRHYHRYASGGAPEVFWRVTTFEPK